MSHIAYLFSQLQTQPISHLMDIKTATIQSIHRIFCLSASHRHVSYPTSCYGRSQVENVELHGWPSHQRHLTGREKRHLGGFRDDEIVILWEFPILELFFFLKVLIRKFILGNQHVRDHYIHRDLYAQVNQPGWRNGIFVFLWFFMAQFRWGRLKTDSVKSWHWNIPADGLKTDSVNFWSAGYFLFRETRPAMTRSVFCCEMLCAKGTHYVSQDVLSIILDDLDEKINPKKLQWAQLACRGVSTHWTAGFLMRWTHPPLNQRISWKSQEHLTGSGHCPGSWVTKEWQMVRSWKLVQQD